MSSEISTSEINYGLGSSFNLTIFCEHFTFHVHRDVISQTSEIWNNMLTGGFVEGSSGSITLYGDDPIVLKLSLDIIYGLLLGKLDCTNFAIDAAEKESLHVLIDKYELKGVSAFLQSIETHHIAMEQLKIQNQNTVSRLQSDLRVTESELQWETDNRKGAELRLQREINQNRARIMAPGMLVDYQDHPPVGTRVIENKDCKYQSGRYDGAPRRGTIIANDEDGGTEIGVRWDNGGESHHLWCGKKGGHALKYL